MNRKTELAQLLRRSSTSYGSASPKATLNKKEEILDILSSRTLNSLDKESAQKAGEIREKLMEKGEKIGHLDAFIAGIAVENGEKILTRNIDEFRRIKELVVEEY